MPRRKYAHKTHYDPSVIPFENAQEAWFWFIRCQKRRRAGMAKTDGGDVARPCEADDICRAVKSLAAQRKIMKEHLLVLGRFGLLEQPPDARRADQSRAARRWSEALDRLTTVLKTKAIVQ